MILGSFIYAITLILRLVLAHRTTSTWSIKLDKEVGDIYEGSLDTIIQNISNASLGFLIPEIMPGVKSSLESKNVNPGVKFFGKPQKNEKTDSNQAIQQKSLKQEKDEKNLINGKRIKEKLGLNLEKTDKAKTDFKKDFKADKFEKDTKYIPVEATHEEKEKTPGRIFNNTSHKTDVNKSVTKEIQEEIIATMKESKVEENRGEENNTFRKVKENYVESEQNEMRNKTIVVNKETQYKNETQPTKRNLGKEETYIYSNLTIDKLKTNTSEDEILHVENITKLKVNNGTQKIGDSTLKISPTKNVTLVNKRNISEENETSEDSTETSLLDSSSGVYSNSNGKLTEKENTFKEILEGSKKTIKKPKRCTSSINSLWKVPNPCNSYVTSITLKYLGEDNVTVVVDKYSDDERKAGAFFQGNHLTITKPKDYKAYVYVDDCLDAVIILDCRHQLYKGMKIGNWEIVRGQSLNGGGIEHPYCVGKSKRGIFEKLKKYFWG